MMSVHLLNGKNAQDSEVLTKKCILNFMGSLHLRREHTERAQNTKGLRSVAP